MRVIVFGAGAVGSVIGGRLRQGGTDVVLVARQAHAEAIRAHGLLLRTASGIEAVDVDVVTTIADITPGDDDVVVITAKTQDTPPIHSALLDWNPDVAVVCATNGVEHERMALRLFRRVYAMVVNLPAQFERPGEVTALWAPANAILDVGCYPSGVDDVATTLAATLAASPRLSSEADADVMTKKYGKLLVNLGNVADAAASLAGRRAAVVADAIEEGKRVYAAAGIRWEQPADDAARYEARLKSMRFDIPEGDTFVGGSTWQSLMKGATSLETDYFQGEIILLARLHGLDVPANEFLRDYASRLLRGELPVGKVPLEQLDADWREWSTRQALSVSGTDGSSS
ncbi:MAG TPA: 2-dehydropantoate 2-reductase N-terminal domain-containing protein [Ilumatobacteraceae bacterium]